MILIHMKSHIHKSKHVFWLICVDKVGEVALLMRAQWNTELNEMIKQAYGLP